MGLKQVNFKKIGSFNSLDSNEESLSGKGVYLWVLDSNPKRIIYVGTATGQSGFFKRLNEEREQILRGQHFIIKPDPINSDPYQFLRFGENYDKENNELAEYYASKKSFIWIPSARNKNVFNDEFDKGWKEYVESEYFNKLIEIYASENIEDNEKIKYLEAQLQFYIKKKFKIGYYKRGRGIKKYQSWLGRPEVPINKDLQSKHKFQLNEEVLSIIDNSSNGVNFSVELKFLIGENL